MQQYDVIFCLRLDLGHVYERIHNNSGREPMANANGNKHQDSVHPIRATTIKSASGSKVIGPI
jgi:hypothetical protein